MNINIYAYINANQLVKKGFKLKCDISKLALRWTQTKAISQSASYVVWYKPASRARVGQWKPARSPRRSRGLRGRFSLIQPCSAGRLIILAFWMMSKNDQPTSRAQVGQWKTTPQPSAAPQASGQVFTDPPLLCCVIPNSSQLAKYSTTFVTQNVYFIF